MPCMLMRDKNRSKSVQNFLNYFELQRTQTEKYMKGNDRITFSVVEMVMMMMVMMMAIM